MLLSLLTLALLPLTLASPVESTESNSTLTTRTFNPSIWGNGAWWGVNDCADASKSSHCFSRGNGWGCNRQCICIPPSNYDGCKDDNKWRNCKSKGHGWGCNNKCECTPPPQQCKDTIVKDCTSKGKGTNTSCQCECRPWIKYYCKKKGGYLNPDTCQCTLPSKTPKHKRNLAQIKRGVCSEQFSACALDTKAKRPIFECVDTERTLDSCGGCTSEGEGVDCTTLEGAEDVECMGGKCVVMKCERGYEISFDGQSCERDVRYHGHAQSQGQGRQGNGSASASVKGLLMGGKGLGEKVMLY